MPGDEHDHLSHPSVVTQSDSTDCSFLLILRTMDRDRAENSAIEGEVYSQPTVWRRAAAEAASARLPEAGQRVAVLGCGTSLFVAQAVARWREDAGHGASDAFSPSEMPPGRGYDSYVAISRSGTTTEVLRALDLLAGEETYAISAGSDNPVAERARHIVSLPFADEQAIVQTRFSTSVVALWRAYLGHDVERVAAEAEDRLEVALPDGLTERRQFVFLGHGPSVGLANEAALKLREAALMWTEAYPAMELRHGPISPLGPQSLVWSLAQLPDGLAEEVQATGAGLELLVGDPLAELVRIHRAAIVLARAKGLDPDRPPRLARSVVLA
jgi:fructoselysine-6-P-deglycase FrlB-like protein